jgi:hypothetical protein
MLRQVQDGAMGAEAEGPQDAAEANREQTARADNREKMLRFWLAAADRAVRLSCHATSGELEGTLRTTDAKQEVFLLSGLKTPLGEYKETLVRQGDLLRMEFL